MPHGVMQTFVIFPSVSYGVVQEVCYIQTFPTWSVMTMFTTDNGLNLSPDDQTQRDSVGENIDEHEHILVRKGCVDRTV